MVYLLKKTNFLIHLCHDKGKKQRSLHYPFSNSARNAVVIREVKRVLSTLRGWYYVSISPPPPTPLPGLVVVVVLSGSLMLPSSSMYL